MNDTNIQMNNKHNSLIQNQIKELEALIKQRKIYLQQLTQLIEEEPSFYKFKPTFSKTKSMINNHNVIRQKEIKNLRKKLVIC